MLPTKTLPVPESASGEVATLRFRRCAKIAALFGIYISIAALLGSRFDLLESVVVVSGSALISAVSLLLAGISLLLLQRPEQTARMCRLARAVALLSLLLGVFTMLKYLGSGDIGLDQLSFLDASGAPFTGPASLAAASTMCLIAFALLSIDRKTRSGFHPTELAAGAAALVTLAGLVSYCYDAASLTVSTADADVAPYIGFGYLAISLGLMCARPDRGGMSIVFGDTMGGYVARRLCPAAVLVPFAAGAVHLLDQRERLLGVGTASAAVLNMALALILVLWIARSLHRRDLSNRSNAHEVFETNKALEARAQRLETVNSELEAFTYAVSDDLRAPLRTIDAFSATLVEDYSNHLDDLGKSRLERIRAGCQRMSRLIDDMLALSRLTRHQMRRESVDLAKIVRFVADDLMRAHPDRRIKFTAPDVLKVDADRVLLHTVIENLLDNAWKFTRLQHAARVEFGVCEINGETVFFVEDNGAGFDMVYIDKLFGTFQRLHDQTFPGTGIGLAAVQRVVYRHGGRVWAEGTVGKGATFYFTLPKASDRAAPVLAARAPDTHDAYLRRSSAN